MDPNANLEQQRNCARAIQRLDDSIGDSSELTEGYELRAFDERRADIEEQIRDEATGLAALVLALDEWLTKGGFAPQAWTPLISNSNFPSPPFEVLEAVRELLAYNWPDEERDFEENPPDEIGKGHHIYERMQTIDAWLGTVNL